MKELSARVRNRIRGFPADGGRYGAERVILRTGSWYFQNVRVIGDIVEAGDTIVRFADGTKLLVQTDHVCILSEVLVDGYLGDGTSQGSRC